MFDDENIFESMRRETQNDNLHRLIDKFEIIHFGHYIAAIPFDTPEEIVRGIIASMATYSLGNKSIDYVLKRYGDKWEFSQGRKEAILPSFEEISEIVQKEIYEIIDWVQRIDQKPGDLGLVTANAALVRLQSSFRTANLLIRLGYIFEASALAG